MENTRTPGQLRLAQRAETFRETCERYGTTPQSVTRQDKNGSATGLRYEIWLDLWTSTDWPLTTLARLVKRHHATVVYGIRKAAMARYGTGERVSLAEVREAALSGAGAQSQVEAVA
jgi:hypothetical protein